MTKSLGTLAPGFLIASPPLGDPNFNRTVVLLAIHSDNGALGFVVNRAAPLPLGQLLAFGGYGNKGAGDTSTVYVGGPVQPSSGWLLCVDPSLSSDDSGVIRVDDRIRVTSSRSAFDALARDVGTRKPGAIDAQRRTVILGYSGWGPGQLEGEIAAGAWLPVPLDERVLFDVSLENRWEQAYAILGLQPAAMMSMRGGGDA